MTFSYTSWWSHSAFGFPAGALLLLLLLRELDHGSATEPSRRALVLLGIGTGIFASTTIYYGAWGVGMLLALLIARRLAHHPRQRAIADAVAFATSCVAGFGLMLLPIYNRVSYFFGFVVSLLNHTNSYVGTDVGPLLPRMASNLADLFNAAPQLVIASAVLLVVTALTLLFARMRLAEHPGLGGLACGLSAQVLVLYLVILNDYSSKYFLTVAVVLPILALALLKLYEWPRAVSAWWQVGAVLLLAAGLVVAFNAQLQSQLNLNAKIARRVRQQETSIAQYTRQTSKAEDKMIILWSIGTYSPCNSLWFGNAWAGFAFNQEMTKLCPNYYYVLTDQVSHVSKVSEDAKLVVQSLNSLNWDMFLGCRESFLQAVGTNAAQYNVFTPKPSSVINCGVGELGTFAIVTRK